MWFNLDEIGDLTWYHTKLIALKFFLEKYHSPSTFSKNSLHAKFILSILTRPASGAIHNGPVTTELLNFCTTLMCKVVTISN